MTKHEHARPTPPSQAPGEGGDPEAREEADEAARPRTPEDASASGSAEGRPSEKNTPAAVPDESDA
ncbi:hypothetical protein [Streptomyces sp. N50]|uniref:hypothetical protein n=1 Tax=Streptomyces sp. N50 TaxID=3081765 RepID=UPI00296223D5|nr:hypothetical protein [Streptomyces sp. N50]WOX13776.1 hypothetical protein R2B38_35295 [Streptomyces sp. N50]